jgi:DNA-directed RNA polymerase specialized sigma24 family protein
MNAHTAVPDASGAESIAPTAESADVDEATVVARAQAGQEAAFEWLYAKYHTRFYNFVYRLMGSAPDAEDLTADAFLKMWLALPKTSDDLRFRSRRGGTGSAPTSAWTRCATASWSSGRRSRRS